MSDMTALLENVTVMADSCTSHMAGTDGGEDPSTSTSYIIRVCRVCFHHRGKGKRKPNLGGVKAGRKTRERTRNQVLKDAVAANKGRPIEIGFEDRQINTVSLPAPTRTQWGNTSGMIRSSVWKIQNNTNKATLKSVEQWIRDPETGAYDLDRIRRGKPDEYTDDEWEKYINFWNDPANAQRAETNRLNRSKSTVVSRHGSRSIPLTRHLMMILYRVYGQKMTSATKMNLQISTRSIVCTPLTVYSKILRLSGCMIMREHEATGDTPLQKSTRWSEAESFAATFLAWVRFADAFARYDSGGASRSAGVAAQSFPSDMSMGNLLPPWHQFLDQKIRGAHFSLGIVAGERFAIELTPSTFPQRHFAGDRFPQRHVAGEMVGMLLGKASNVVVD
ncbi:hypothetical protein Tco_0649104 [Tanacetum coccineum]